MSDPTFGFDLTYGWCGGGSGWEEVVAFGVVFLVTQAVSAFLGPDEPAG